MNNFFAAVLVAIEQNLALITAWLVLFQLIVVLYILWLSWRIRTTEPSKALDVAEENKQAIYAVKTKMDKLDSYIRDSFSKDFSGAMQSFDATTASVLNQMKDELVQGVKRIEQIETAVSKKNALEDRVKRGGEDIKKLVNAPDEKLTDAEEDETVDEAAVHESKDAEMPSRKAGV